MLRIFIYGASKQIGSIALDVLPTSAKAAAKHFERYGFEVEAWTDSVHVRQPRRANGKRAGIALRNRFGAAHKYYEGTGSYKALAEFLGRVVGG